jgi:hypothetical protein
MRSLLPSATWILVASGFFGCSSLPSGKPDLAYRAGPVLVATNDPLAPKREFPAWNPPKQFAVWVHPREDPSQGVLLGGQWVLENLTPGGWYTEDFPERDPVPTAEATPEDVERARAAVGPLSEFVVPYRIKESKP